MTLFLHSDGIIPFLQHQLNRSTNSGWVPHSILFLYVRSPSLPSAALCINLPSSCMSLPRSQWNWLGSFCPQIVTLPTWVPSCSTGEPSHWVPIFSRVNLQNQSASIFYQQFSWLIITPTCLTFIQWLLKWSLPHASWLFTFGYFINLIIDLSNAFFHSYSWPPSFAPASTTFWDSLVTRSVQHASSWNNAHSLSDQDP